jgi:hypothetical protein
LHHSVEQRRHEKLRRGEKRREKERKGEKRRISLEDGRNQARTPDFVIMTFAGFKSR